MFFKQYELSCLSLYSYLIADESTGRAVVVDPQRDISGYVADAQAHGFRIERVIETHFHADFVSGHLELAAATGATISYGDQAHTDFPIDPLAHGQKLKLGETALEIRHTPGHTPESISIVLHERADDPPWGVLTGDALFIGDVGRPDLLTSIGWTADASARLLYQSLHKQLLTLPDATRVYPAHGAGSACGKHMSTAAESTIGEQRETNYALQPMTEDRFVDVVTEGQTVAPLYFAIEDIEEVLIDRSELAQAASRLTAHDVADWLNDTTDAADQARPQLVDIRNAGETDAGVITGAKLLPLSSLLDGLDQLDAEQPTVVYCVGGYRSSIAASLLRAQGFSSVADIIGGFGAWSSAGYPTSASTTTPES